ncbi:hypothetical protein AB0E63_43740 [Kribbella sp. NPDC026596]|uniref:hypothetical protein n=1 Tax=Kribbella sp. NPDC026596 TaxID=3155122 RepID=UPI0033E8AED7
MAVKISPLRPEPPIDEAADAIAMGRDDFRSYVADGAVSLRSTEYVDWVRLDEVIAWDNKRREERGAPGTARRGALGRTRRRSAAVMTESATDGPAQPERASSTPT